MGHFAKVLYSEAIDTSDIGDSELNAFQKAKAYKRIAFSRPIQFKPDANGSIEEQAMAAEEAADPINARVENRAQFVEGMNVYLSPQAVAKVFDDFDINGIHRHLEKQNQGAYSKEYHMHCDPAKVNDDFAVMICHSELNEPDEFGISYKHMIVDWYSVYKSSQFESGQIEYRPILNDIKQLIALFRLKTISFDQFNSVMPIQDLMAYCHDNNIACKVFEETFTGSKNTKMYEILKMCINEHWVHSYFDDMNTWETARCMLQAELEALQIVNGKVVKPRIGNLGHSDLVDCLMVLAYRLLSDQTNARADRYLNNVVSSPSDSLNSAVSDIDAYAKPSKFKSPYSGMF
jgi:hypothetical protein